MIFILLHYKESMDKFTKSKVDDLTDFPTCALHVKKSRRNYRRVYERHNLCRFVHESWMKSQITTGVLQLASKPIIIHLTFPLSQLAIKLTSVKQRRVVVTRQSCLRGMLGAV